MICEVRSDVGSIELVGGVGAGFSDGWLRLNMVGEPAPTADKFRGYFLKGDRNIRWRGQPEFNY
ncbi:hypothetical protein QUA86_08175 [Microcoleus sp. F6_B6]